MTDEELYKNQKIVVKPKTTNFGIGISILEAERNSDDFSQAVEKAFSYDQSILIEEFLEGIECRFLVINGVCVAVLHRVPANVQGDGQSTIKQLIEQKNKGQLRGKGYKTPLQIIELGNVEMEVLKSQGLHPESIPEKDQKIFLRYNSNLSTGGDSIDYTDKVPLQYKKIAEEATKAVGAQICGVDIILKNPEETSTKKNYGIIEVNYNPALFIHNFPSEGQNRHVEKYVLDLLGF